MTVGRQLESEVARRMLLEGYEVRKEVQLRHPKPLRVDILVKNQKKQVAIEVKSRPPLLNDIRQLVGYVDSKPSSGKTAGIICVAQEHLTGIPESVRSYADQAHVRVCGLETVVDEVRSVLGSPERADPRDTGTRSPESASRVDFHTAGKGHPTGARGPRRYGGRRRRRPRPSPREREPN